MEQTYYLEWLNSHKELNQVQKENEKLREELKKKEALIEFLKGTLDGLTNL